MGISRINSEQILYLWTHSKRSMAPVDKDGAPCGYDDASGEVGRHYIHSRICALRSGWRYAGRGGASGGAGRLRHSE